MKKQKTKSEFIVVEKLGTKEEEKIKSEEKKNGKSK